jgi:hypothetical protein
MDSNLDSDNMYIDKTSILRQELTDLIFNENENETENKTDNKDNHNKVTIKTNKISKFQKSKL